MPTDIYYIGPPRKRTWRRMNRYARKEFHRENQMRRMAGKPPKPKPY